MASLVPTRTRTLLPAPHEKAPSFLSFPPMILGAHPVSRFQHRLSRMYAYARAPRAPQSVSEKSLHLFTHLAYFTIAQRIKGEDFIIFSFTSLVPWRHPKVKNFRRGFSPKTGTNREKIGGSKTVKAKVKEKAKTFTPKQQSVNVLRPVCEGVKAFFENHLTCARTRAREHARLRCVFYSSCSARSKRRSPR